MDEKTLKIFADAFVKELVAEGKEICKGIYDEGKQFIGKSVKTYLDKQRTKFSSVKTLLRGNTPVFLYDVYYPINVSEEAETILTNNIANPFENGNFVTIIGDAGSGKSTLMKHLFLNSIEVKFGIPVLIELRYLNETDGDIEKFIIEKIFENKISQNVSILERFLENGKFVFFLDGFDELNSTIKDKVVKNLLAFIELYGKNKFILTSRPYSNIENLPQFRNLYINKLDAKDISGFIELQLKSEKELAKKIKKSITDSKSTYIQSFLSNPLLLTLYILTFQTYAEIPDKKYIFYRRVINALFSEHDSKTKLGFVREKLSQLNQEQFEELLRAFSFVSYFGGNYSFDFDYINETLRKIKEKITGIKFDNNKFITDLKSAISLWVEDNGRYSFAHRSLQEYFAASFIKNLNSEENKRAYQTIRVKFGNSERLLSEYENFLSLCNEMDEVNYNQYYCIPILKELRSYLDNSSRENLVKSFLMFFAKGVSRRKLLLGSEISKEKETLLVHNSDVIIKNEVYENIFFHFKFTHPLYKRLRECVNSIPNEYFQTPLKEDSKHGFACYFEQHLGNGLLAHFMKHEIYNLCNDFLIFVENEIVEREKVILQSNKTDKELLDLLG